MLYALTQFTPTLKSVQIVFNSEEFVVENDVPQIQTKSKPIFPTLLKAQPQHHFLF